jgi:predicted RNA binding protein YcfA (HicA-like mRNA interferase family)
VPRKIRQLKSDLRRAGFMLVPRRGKGSHTVWIHPISGTSVTVSGSDGDDARYYQEQDVRDAIAEALRATYREGE